MNMKKLVLVIAVFASAPALAFDSGMFYYMLNSAQVKAELEGRDLQNIEFEKEFNGATSWKFTARIQSVESGLGPQGADTHPCTTIVEVSVIGGVAGTEVSPPAAKTVCAMNSPKFPRK
jgi:hypothetical protein